MRIAFEMYRVPHSCNHYNQPSGANLSTTCLPHCSSSPSRCRRWTQPCRPPQHAPLTPLRAEAYRSTAAPNKTRLHLGLPISRSHSVRSRNASADRHSLRRPCLDMEGRQYHHRQSSGEVHFARPSQHSLAAAFRSSIRCHKRRTLRNHLSPPFQHPRRQRARHRVRRTT